jgi:uncharacterized lipoprotein YajG
MKKNQTLAPIVVKHFKTILMLALGSLLFQGCVAFPPLIQVKHEHAAPKATASNDEVLKRLDAIDNRLNQIEKEARSNH